MSADHERYATWDAAYALGALSTTERAEFEAHLADCPRCRAAVAEIGSTVSLLSQVDAEEALRIGTRDADDAGAVRVLAAARALRSARRRLGAWAAGIAAAVVVALAVSVSLLLPPPADAVALEPVAGAPVTASVSLTAMPWGTRLEVVCAYDGYRTGEAGTYGLVVTGDDGAESTLSTWSVEPGATARLSAATSLPTADIRSIEIRDESGTVMVRHEFD